MRSWGSAFWCCRNSITCCFRHYPSFSCCVVVVTEGYLLGGIYLWQHRAFVKPMFSLSNSSRTNDVRTLCGVRDVNFDGMFVVPDSCVSWQSPPRTLDYSDANCFE